MTEPSGSFPARHFTVQSLARYWGVSPSHIYNLIHVGAIRYLRIGKAIRIPALSVKEYEEAACRVTTISTNLNNDLTAFGISVGTMVHQKPQALNAYQRGQQTASKQKNSAHSTSQE